MDLFYFMILFVMKYLLSFLVLSFFVVHFSLADIAPKVGNFVEIGGSDSSSIWYVLGGVGIASILSLILGLKKKKNQ